MSKHDDDLSEALASVPLSPADDPDLAVFTENWWDFFPHGNYFVVQLGEPADAVFITNAPADDLTEFAGLLSRKHDLYLSVEALPTSPGLVLSRLRTLTFTLRS